MPDDDNLPGVPGDPFRILTMDGGGAKGVYSLGVLREVEAVCKKPLSEVFDLIFGTSTGAIISALLALGKTVSEIEKLYFSLIPAIMNHRTRGGRSKALKTYAEKTFGDLDFSAFKTDIGIVCTNLGSERPMVFKSSIKQAHGRKATFKPGFGCSIAKAVVASCSAYPFFDKVHVQTENQGEVYLMDGGYVANNPTLFALADARHAFKVEAKDIRVLSVGVGTYNEPKRTVAHRFIFGLPFIKHAAKMFNITSVTIDQLRVLLFPDIQCVRVSETYAQNEYATDLLEEDLDKLKLLQSLGRDSFGKFERDIRAILPP